MELDLTRKTKKMCSATAVAYLVFLLVFILLISSYFSSLQRLDLHNRLTIRDQNRPIILSPQATDPGPQEPKPGGLITCDRSHYRYDLCKINGPAVLDPTTATLYATGPHVSLEEIKPYPRKWERSVMEGIRSIRVKTGPRTTPKCGVHHNSPAVVFSAGGYTGNFFHDIGDGVLPLFITVNSLSLADKRDVILVVDQAHTWWVHKYADVIRGFTKHPIINLANNTSSETHCFKWATVGLISHGFMTLNPKAQPGPLLTLAHFHSFLRNIYNNNKQQLQIASPTRPRLVWLGRAGSRGRVMVNQEEARSVAEQIGFEVIVYKPTKKMSLRKAYEVINGSHAMIGVHGAAMTHLFFLREGSVVVQVVPLGLEWAGEECFGMPARDVGLDYMVYKVGMNESSLTRKYNKEDPILKDVEGITKNKGWVGEVMNVYLREQNVEIDLVKFRGFMEEVYVRAKAFMELHG